MTPPLFFSEEQHMRVFIPFEDQWDAAEDLTSRLMPYQPGMPALRELAGEPQQIGPRAEVGSPVIDASESA
ncbi:hypothetical protein ACYJW8_08230 [Frateuria aurantia]